jgi:sugar phosphate isomerase/epimerase
MRWNTRTFHTTDFDCALETAAETGWTLYELGHRHTLPTDAEAVRACAELAARLLQRGAVTTSELSPHPRPVTADRIAIGVTRTVQTAAVKRALREGGCACWPRHRHRHACIVVARAGIPELPDAHPSAEPVHLGVPVKFPDGWQAHQAFMAHLAKHRVCAA